MIVPEDTVATSQERYSITFFFSVASAAILFLFAMMQMSAITYPFWDHWEQASAITTYYKEGLWAAIWHVFTSLSQHTRPVTVRLIFLFNGILTRWDIGSEYVYMYATIAATLLLYYKIVRRFAGTPRCTASEALVFSIIVVLYCSPANHNNHWWSWMLQLTLNNLLSILALYVIAFRGTTTNGNILAALLCWMSVYTLTNGLFLLFTVAALAQFSSQRPLRPSTVTAFWLVNIVLVLWTYFPIAEPGMTAHPEIKSVIHFALMYLGEPIAALIRFPYYNMFEPPNYNWTSTICGSLLSLAAAALLFTYREYFRTRPPHFVFLVGTFVFVGLSALATGWARVTFDMYGIRNGNSSRYVITGSLFLIAMLCFLVAERETIIRRFFSNRSSDFQPEKLAWVAYGIFILFASTSYFRSVHIYTEAREFNRKLASGFAPGGAPTATDPSLYPNPDRLKSLRDDLVRYKIGPYSGDQIQLR